MLTDYIHQAMRLTEEGKDLEIPNFLTEALKMNEPARKILESFNHSNQKDYVEWLTEAKTQTTRKKRIATTLE